MKGFFFYYFFFKSYKYSFFGYKKIYLYFKNIKRLFNKFFYKKIYYNIFLFNIKVFFHKNKNILYKLKKSLKFLIKIKVLIILRSFFYIFILQFINFWLNFYFLIKNLNNYLLNFDIILNSMYKNLIFIKIIK
jgi:hypothetical protein